LVRVCWVLQALAKHARLARDTCTRVFFLALPPNRTWSSSQPIPGALFAQRKDRSMSRNLEGDDGPGGTRVRRMSCSCLVVCAWSLMCLQEYHEGWISCNVSNWHIDAWWWGLACSFRPTASNYHTPFSLFDGFIYDQSKSITQNKELKLSALCLPLVICYVFNRVCFCSVYR
jgi:hypothetical protein